MMKEINDAILKGINRDNIYTEIHRLEGRIDFLLFCKDIPQDVKDREMATANSMMMALQMKLLMYGLEGVL